MSEPIKLGVDAVAAGLTASAIMQFVPPATAILTFIWVSIRIYESKTVQKLIKKKREK